MSSSAPACAGAVFKLIPERKELPTTSPASPTARPPCGKAKDETRQGVGSGWKP
jgi:hypothetical protein